MVVARGYSMAFGARFLKRYIDEHVKLPISAQWKSGSHFDVKVKDGGLVVEPSIAKLPSADEALAYGDVT
jgi:ATP-dependent Clp protease ATP-binding subunit ClpA